MSDRAASAARHWLFAGAVLAVTTVLLLGVRGVLDKSHVALGYLLAVLVVSARGGRAPGIAVSVAGFLAFNFFFLPPYYTLVVTHALDWAVLAAFLVTSLIASQLLARARAEAAAAQQHAVEVERLAGDARRADELHRANEMKDAVLASVSHDLRTPLTTIKALANQIRQGGDDRAATIEEEADRLNRFVADLLDLSRLAGGALQVVPEVNAAEDLIGAALQRTAGAAGDRNVIASIDTTEPLLLGRFDFVHALRVLANLIDNAMKYAPAHSTIEVQARRVNGTLEFVVADRGPGIPEPDRELVFEAFYRRPGVPSDVSGAGLGLSIARGLAEAQGGTLCYEERAGGGSRFVFSVPAADLVDLGERATSL